MLKRETTIIRQSCAHIRRGFDLSLSWTFSCRIKPTALRGRRMKRKREREVKKEEEEEEKKDLPTFLFHGEFRGSGERDSPTYTLPWQWDHAWRSLFYFFPFFSWISARPEKKVKVITPVANRPTKRRKERMGKKKEKYESFTRPAFCCLSSQPGYCRDGWLFPSFSSFFFAYSTFLSFEFILSPNDLLVIIIFCFLFFCFFPLYLENHFTRWSACF